jgi:transcriptional regulator with XRE-family HTH domain
MQKEKILERLDEILNTGHWQNQTEFCEVVGITPQILSNFRSKEMNREPPKSLIYGLARMNYNITWFLFGHGSMKNYSTSNDEVLELRHKISTLSKIKDIIEKEEHNIEEKRVFRGGVERTQ